MARMVFAMENQKKMKDVLWDNAVSYIFNGEVEDTRTAGICIRDTTCLQCDSMNNDTYFSNACRMGVHNFSNRIIGWVKDSQLPDALI